VDLVECGGREGGVIYKAEGGGETLDDGSVVGVSYVVKVEITGEPVKTNLGTIMVKWRPAGTRMEGIVVPGVDGEWCGSLPNCVGPELRFRNPEVIIESAPFDVRVTMPNSCQVGSPVNVVFKVVNQTPLQQRLSVQMEESKDNSILVDGVKEGKVDLNPREETFLNYTAVFLVPGKCRMPGINVVSLRHGTFLVEGEKNGLSLFVFPVS